MKKIAAVLFLIIASFGLSKAQDTIVKKNGDILRVKITEIGTEEIKFKTFGVADSPVIVILKSEVRIVKVGGQTIIDQKEEPPKKQVSEDILVKKDGTTLKVTVIEIGTSEVKFRLFNDPDGPLISIDKSDIKSLKVGDQMVIETKKEAEDQIVKKDGTTLRVKVLEMGSDEVKFKLFTSPDGPLMSLKKSEIKTVKIDGQIVYEYKVDPYSTSNSLILDKTSSAKFHFFSPLNRNLAFSYEWMNKPGFNYEAGIGIIGIGVSLSEQVNDIHPRGFFLRFGPKFLLGNSSDIESPSARYAHPLKGRYFKPEIILNAMSARYPVTFYSSSGSTTNSTIEKKYQSAVVNLVYGRQNIYGNAVTVGYYIGIGYGFENVTTTGGTTNGAYSYYDYDPRRYSHVYFGKNFPLTFTYGLTIGYIHKPPVSKSDKSYRNNPRAPK